MTGYRVLGLILLVVAVVCGVHANWLGCAIAAFLALFCLLGRVDRKVKDRPWSDA